MNSVKHIVIVSPGFPESASDDTCIPPLQSFVLEFINSHPNVQLEVIALHYPEAKHSYYWKGIKVHSLHGSRWGKIGKLYLWLQVHRLLKSIHKNRQIDLVHTLWLNDATLMVQSFCIKRDILLVATIMGQDALSGNLYLKLIDLKYVRVVALSNQVAHHFEQNTSHTVLDIIPWGIDSALLRKTGNETPKNIDILAVGSLIDIKNYEEFLNVIKSVVDREKKVRVVVFGKGGKAGEIERKIRQLELVDHIELRGSQARSNVLQAMEQSKLLLHTARYEGQGYVFLEALAKGLPIVCYEVGFLPQLEMVHICNNSDEMIDSVLTILREPETGGGKIALDIQETVHEYWKIYHQEAQKPQ